MAHNVVDVGRFIVSNFLTNAYCCVNSITYQCEHIFCLTSANQLKINIEKVFIIIYLHTIRDTHNRNQMMRQIKARGQYDTFLESWKSKDDHSDN